MVSVPSQYCAEGPSRPADRGVDRIGGDQLREDRDEEEGAGQDEADEGGERDPHFGCLSRGLAMMPMMSASMLRKM